VTEHPLRLFINFVEDDHLIVEFESQIEALKAQIASLLGEQAEHQQTLEKAERAIVDAHKEVDAQELQMNSLGDQAKVIARKLENTANPKEFFSLTKELEAIQHQQLAQEEVVLQAWRLLEKNQADSARIKDQFKQKEEENAQQLIKKQQELEQVQKEFEAVQAQRLKDAVSVPEEWMSKYIKMRESVKNPVVPARNGFCSACSHIITTQDLVRLSKNALIECKGCFRFLFSPERLAAMKANERNA